MHILKLPWFGHRGKYFAIALIYGVFTIILTLYS